METKYTRERSDFIDFVDLKVVVAILKHLGIKCEYSFTNQDDLTTHIINIIGVLEVTITRKAHQEVQTRELVEKVTYATSTSTDPIKGQRVMNIIKRITDRKSYSFLYSQQHRPGSFFWEHPSSYMVWIRTRAPELSLSEPKEVISINGKKMKEYSIFAGTNPVSSTFMAIAGRISDATAPWEFAHALLKCNPLETDHIRKQLIDAIMK